MADLEYEYGYGAGGIESLIAEVNSIVIEGAGKLAVDGVAEVEKICDAYWDGEAEKNFVKNLKADSKVFKESLVKLKKAFEAELENAGKTYQDFDKNMIN